MKTIIGITAALLITVLSVAYLYFSNLNITNRSNNQILSEIPLDASVVFQHQNDQSLYDIFEDYTIFDTIAVPKRRYPLAKQLYTEQCCSKTLNIRSEGIFIIPSISN